MIRLPRAFAVVAGVLTLTTISATSARAQYGRPNVSDPAIGEKYHVEAVLNLWNPSLDATISSESLGIIGSEIDVKADLGYQDKSIREFRFVLRPARKHKFRVAYTPVSLDSDILLQKEIIFNGIRFNIGLPLQSEFKWNTWRFGYEYDFVYRDRFYAGFILEGRYMDASLNLRTPIDDEFAEARGVLPAVGGIVRGYVHGNSGLLRQLLRPRHLRHRQHHQQLRGSGRLPLARRILRGRARHGRPRDEGVLLHRRRPVLSAVAVLGPARHHSYW